MSYVADRHVVQVIRHPVNVNECQTEPIDLHPNAILRILKFAFRDWIVEPIFVHNVGDAIARLIIRTQCRVVVVGCTRDDFRHWINFFIGHVVTHHGRCHQCNRSCDRCDCLRNHFISFVVVSYARFARIIHCINRGRVTRTEFYGRARYGPRRFLPRRYRYRALPARYALPAHTIYRAEFFLSDQTEPLPRLYELAPLVALSASLRSAQIRDE